MTDSTPITTSAMLLKTLRRLLRHEPGPDRRAQAIRALTGCSVLSDDLPDPKLPVAPMLWAVHHRAADLMTAIAACGGRCVAGNARTTTALHVIDSSQWSSGALLLEALQACLTAGADAEAIDKDGRTPLLAFCNQPDRFGVAAAVVQMLVRAGANVNAVSDRGNTPLILACTIHDPYDVGLVRALLEHGADPHQRNRDGETPLVQAVSQSLEDALDASDMSPVVAAVDLLLAAGSDPNARAKDGGTPLVHAIARNSPDLVIRLLAAGADPVCLSDFDLADATAALAALQAWRDRMVLRATASDTTAIASVFPVPRRRM